MDNSWLALSSEELPGFFLACKYGFVLLFCLGTAMLLKLKRPVILVWMTVLLCLYTWLIIHAPLKRLYAFAPELDRLFNVAMAATSSTGHSPFESYQVGAADLEPFWRLLMKALSLGKPENVMAVYPFLSAAVMVLLAVALYWGLRDPNREEDKGRLWELALIVFAVMLLNSSPMERFGVFRPFWPMNFLLKPNHVLGLVLVALLFRSWNSKQRSVRVVTAGVTLSALAWVFLMHWAFVVPGLLLYPIVAHKLGRRPETKTVLMVVGLSVLGALPYLVFLIDHFGWQEGGAVAQKIWRRTGFEEGYYNFFAVSFEHGAVFLFSVLGMIGMALRRHRWDVIWLSILLGTVVCWVGYMLLMPLQRAIEPDELYFFFRFLLTVAAGSGMYFTLKTIQSSRTPGLDKLAASSVCVLLLLMLPVSFPYWWKPHEMDRYFEIAREPLPQTMTRLGSWVRQETSPDDVFMAGPDISMWIAALSGRRVLLVGNHRPPHDYEERRDLERRMLTQPSENVFREARELYHVTHLALDEDYLSSFGVKMYLFDSLPFLEVSYEGEPVKVFVIHGGSD